MSPPERSPAIYPTPTNASFGPMLDADELVTVDAPVATKALLAELAAERAIPLGAELTVGRRQARLTVTIDHAAYRTQAYRLDVTTGDDGPAVSVRAGDEAGAYYGLLSLAQLIDTSGTTMRLRAATIDDAPGFLRRGAILDPAPTTGISTPETRRQLLDRVRFGVQYKLNFVDLLREPWPELVRYCEDHFVELMVAFGYRDALTTDPRPRTKAILAAWLDAGAHSITLNWDDIPTTDPEGLAQRHAEAFGDLYAFLRSRDPGVRVSTVLPPYGGVPGQRLVGSQAGEGERYLALMKAALPDDVRVFWTGDGGVFSARVTTDGAQRYADAIGHEIALWDNDATRFSQGRLPCSGRAADLATVVPTYMGNLAGDSMWSGTNGEFALLTSLFYTWNPVAYYAAAGGAAAEEILAIPGGAPG